METVVSIVLQAFLNPFLLLFCLLPARGLLAAARLDPLRHNAAGSIRLQIRIYLSLAPALYALWLLAASIYLRHYNAALGWRDLITIDQAWIAYPAFFLCAVFIYFASRPRGLSPGETLFVFAPILGLSAMLYGGQHFVWLYRILV